MVELRPQKEKKIVDFSFINSVPFEYASYEVAVFLKQNIIIMDISIKLLTESISKMREIYI